jgi:soluble lytic murein transglycosylase-like protein
MNLLEKDWFVSLLKITILIAFLWIAMWLGCFLANAEEVDVDTVIMIESSGNPMAYNSGSKAKGLMQITPICLREWNKCHIRDGHSGDELYNPAINRKIGSWYLNEKIPIYLRFYNLEDSAENRLMAYNWGIGNLRKYMRGQYTTIPKETENYIKKYNKLGR